MFGYKKVFLNYPYGSKTTHIEFNLHCLFLYLITGKYIFWLENRKQILVIAIIIKTYIKVEKTPVEGFFL